MFVKANKTNVKVWIFTFFSSFMLFYAPILLIFYKSQQINIFQIGILFAITSLSTIIAEIPFGLFADKISYKLSCLLGYALIISGLIFLLYADSFLGFIVSVILMGIGEAGCSGAITVLFLNDMEDEDQFFYINNFTTYIANALGGLVIGFIFSWNPHLPFLFSILFALINVFIIFRMPDVRSSRVEESKKVNKNNSFSIFSFLWKYRYIFFVFFLSYFLIPQLSVFFPEYLEYFELPVTWFGVVYFFANILPLIGGYIYKKLLKNINSFILLAVSFCLFAICVFGMSFSKNLFVGLGFYTITRITLGWFWLVFSIYFNKIADTSNKATIFSLKSAIMEIAFILSDPLMSLIIFKSNILQNYKVTGILVFSVALIMILRQSYLKMKKVVIE